MSISELVRSFLSKATVKKLKGTYDIQKTYDVQRKLQIMQDCIGLVNDSCTLSVVFSRYDELVDILKFLVAITEDEFQTAGILEHPCFKSKLDEIINKKDIIVNQAIERAYLKEKEQASSLKTENGRRSMIDRFYNDTYNNYSLSSANRKFLTNLARRDNLC